MLNRWRSFLAPAAKPYPGKSTSRQVRFIVNMLMSLVKPGVGETRARPASPARKFSNEDLPTFERPMKANSGRDSSGHESKSGALHSKMADEICTIKNRMPIVAANEGRGNICFWQQTGRRGGRQKMMVARRPRRGGKRSATENSGETLILRLILRA